MFQFPTVWVDHTADSLLDITLRYCINHQNVFSKYNVTTGEYDELLDDVSLPAGICERLFSVSKTEMSEDRFVQFTTLFKDSARTHLRHLDLSGSVIKDHNLEILTRHNIAELNISNCERLTRTSLPYIAKHRNSLVSLNVGESIGIFDIEEDNKPQLVDDALILSFQALYPHNEATQPSNNMELFSGLCFPFLRKLVINGLRTNRYLQSILRNTEHLTYLDLSNCDLDGDALQRLSAQKQLTSLILCDVMSVVQCVPAICQLKSLRHLDISHTGQVAVSYSSPNKAMKSIVESLESLISLDISGTNLAGLPRTKRKSSESEVKKEGENLTDIPGLASRVNRPLEFLGLLNTAHEACFREHIPAKRIAGDATEEQLLIAGQAYCARYQILPNIINKLISELRISTCPNVRLALDVVMEAMRLHPKSSDIQRIGSFSLFYFMNEHIYLAKYETFFNTKMKQKIIKVLLDAMSASFYEETTLRNVILTFFQFRIPEDVYFEYERLVSLLIPIVSCNEWQEETIRLNALRLLHNLICQVDGFYRKLMGDKGAITILLLLIVQHLENNVCDQLMETAWSTMWNITDDAPYHCARYLEEGGLNLFLGCLQAFPEEPEMLWVMTGVLGNVAEVKELRPHLMKDEYLTVFSDLLGNAYIKVNYNAGGILSHIASDGEEAWSRHNIVSVKRDEVLTKMANAIEKWDLDTEDIITYRSFEPILRLLKVDHTPVVQHWAVWALTHLTKVNPERYCSMLKEEGGIDILKKMLLTPGHSRILQLAEIIIKQCERYESGVTEDGDFDYLSELEESQ